VVAWLAGSLPTADAAQDATVVVHLEDHARVPPRDLEAVQKEADRIFRAAGVTVSWANPLRTTIADASQGGPPRVALVMVNLQTPFSGDASDTDEVLGRAAPGRARAWVFVNRIAESAAKGTVDARLLLARVIAHEIGHLLLPSAAHSHVGIMRPSFELDQVGLFLFTNEESRQIRAALAARRADR
jgi:hypothetical protein